jgi:hypothetical protein
MSGLRLWHLMLAIAVAAWTITLLQCDSSCTPMTPVLACSYICSYFGSKLARRRGWPWVAGFLLGFILGPFGLFLAWFRIIPEAEVIAMRRREERSS